MELHQHDKILVVDDNAVFRKILSRQINKYGFETLELTSGSDVIQKMSRHNNEFGLIFLDQTMPELSGMETFLELQETIPDLPPVIMITAHDSLNLALSFMKAGGFDFLVKPIDPDVVGAKIEKALRHHHKQQLKAQPENKTSASPGQDPIENLAIWRCLDRDGKHQWWSEGLIRILGYQNHDENYLIQELITRCDLDLSKRLKKPPSHGESFRTSLTLRCGDQKERNFLLYASCSHQKDKDGFKWQGCLIPEGPVTEETRPAMPEGKTLLHFLANPTAWFVGQQFVAGNLHLNRFIADHTLRTQKEFADFMSSKGYSSLMIPLEKDQLLLFAPHEITNKKETTANARDRLGLIIGKSQAMQPVYEKITQTAKTDSGILIQGESGTGKELTARTIHNLSHRSSGPFVAVNCGAIPPNLFESEFFGHRKGAFTGAIHDKSGYFDQANRGTLFLDEIGELSQENQAKLLRALDKYGYIPVGGKATVKADIRVVAATNRDLTQMMQQGNFREDLFYRINVIHIALPPLRERHGDIPYLTEHLLTNLPKGPYRKLSARQIEALEHHHWPGNVRELTNVLNRFRSIGALEFNPESPSSQAQVAIVKPLAEALAEFEKNQILQALNQNDWHRGKTAKALDLPERTLRRKMSAFGLKT
jgi:DNA-binding NtrC family response regulator